MEPRRRDIVVIGASAGGVEALREVVRGLPADFEATIFAVLHIPPAAVSTLPHILERVNSFTARHPDPSAEGSVFVPRTIYVAPPDRHMVIEGDRVLAVLTEKENRHRPAVDPLFRSAARYHGPRVIGVILTGALDDGAAGLADVKRQGGLAVVQDPDDALFPSMPRNAMATVAVDHCVPLAEIPALLARVTREPLDLPDIAVPAARARETRLSMGHQANPPDTPAAGNGGRHDSRRH